MTKELRRRLGRTVLTALGLGAGVAMVIAIIGVSQGLGQAQESVLAPLDSVGTDILVTRVAGTTSTAQAEISDTQPPQGAGGFFGFARPGASATALNEEDAAALLNENSNVVTDLSKLGNPGDKFTHDFFLSATLLSFPQEAVDEIKSIAGVESVTPGLTQLAEHQTGTVPTIVAEIQTGGEVITTTVRPPEMTEEERQATRECVFERSGGEQGTPPRGGGPGPAFEDCLPERFREYQATVVAPLRTIQQIVNPPSTDITNESYVVAGIDPDSTDIGLITPEQLIEGEWLSSDEPNEILVSVAYANKKSLGVGSTIAINGSTYTVLGLVNPTLTGNTADIYFPLSTLQALAGKEGRVTQVLVKASNSDSVEVVAAEIEELLPGAEVVTTQSLADSVTGSLADAKNLADRLGGALAAIVLVAAFSIAVLLTLSSVAKRVREIGTLRAIGWSRGLVVRQILTETLGIGILGGLIGAGLGFLGATAVEVLSPALTAASSGVPGFASSSFAQFFGQAQTEIETASLRLEAPVTLITIAIGMGFALVGGLIAGAIGGWRASRLAPAEALRNVG